MNYWSYNIWISSPTLLRLVIALGITILVNWYTATPNLLYRVYCLSGFIYYITCIQGSGDHLEVLQEEDEYSYSSSDNDKRQPKERESISLTELDFMLG